MDLIATHPHPKNFRHGRRERHRKQSPDCGHIYMRSSANQPDKSYTVTATSDWIITWSGAGQTGTTRLGGLTRSTQITIGEAQVLVD